ncbi:hypothetical protein GWI33_017891 [Rhynchophorus ferrugineus]|uniref:Uncharacterized protein n=1 Tax=Rhynchophorus ferrugineus TaxID=354439 RepID=A0A834M3A7_RHYFE|nr:hypothetical protein GWI33_017891 [Rhynchophorus ferrugineus]
MACSGTPRKAKLIKYQSNPPYNPDLAPSVYHWLFKLKEYFSDQYFSEYSRVKEGKEEAKPFPQWIGGL